MFLVKMYEQESRNKREQGPIYIVTVSQSHSIAGLDGWCGWGLGSLARKKHVSICLLTSSRVRRQASGRVTIQTIKHDFATQ